jgi:hypothetical protein
MSDTARDPASSQGQVHIVNLPSRPVHEALRSEYDGRRSLFECLMPGCRYRAALDHQDGRYTLLDLGDPSVRHYGTTGPVEITVDGPPDEERAA